MCSSIPYPLGPSWPTFCWISLRPTTAKGRYIEIRMRYSRITPESTFGGIWWLSSPSSWVRSIFHIPNIYSYWESPELNLWLTHWKRLLIPTRRFKPSCSSSNRYFLSCLCLTSVLAFGLWLAKWKNKIIKCLGYKQRRLPKKIGAPNTFIHYISAPSLH